MNDNIFSIQGGKKAQDEDELPVNKYVVEDIDGNEYPGEGFLVFTSQHVAIMRDTGKGAIPVLCVPLDRVKVAEIFEDDEQDDLPF